MLRAYSDPMGAVDASAAADLQRDELGRRPKTDLTSGLDDAEAERRLQAIGPNELPAEPQRTSSAGRSAAMVAWQRSRRASIWVRSRSRVSMASWTMTVAWPG